MGFVIGDREADEATAKLIAEIGAESHNKHVCRK
jgi:hypothetical protein